MGPYISTVAIVQFGALIVMAGAINFFISAGLLCLSKYSAARHLAIAAAGLTAVGLVCLALVGMTSGWGIFNA
jgi:hypothetical protein